MGKSLELVDIWNQRFLLKDKSGPNQLDFLYYDKKHRKMMPYYQLAVVGGVAVNSSIRKHYPTKDLDLKLTCNIPIDRSDYYHLYETQFNPLRARIALEFVNTLNKIADANQAIFNQILHYDVLLKLRVSSMFYLYL